MALVEVFQQLWARKNSLIRSASIFSALKEVIT